MLVMIVFVWGVCCFWLVLVCFCVFECCVVCDVFLCAIVVSCVCVCCFVFV